MRQRPWLLTALAAAFAVAGSAWLASRPSPVRAEGVTWTTSTLDEALADARARDGRVLVKFEAAWCTVCRQLDREVLQTPAGGALTADAIALRFDFDDPANRPLVERFVVLELPTVLVLTPDGHQVGRLDGYDGRDAWLAAAQRAMTADDPIPGLRARFVERPDDPALARELGEALLVRGFPTEGEALLERVTFMEGDAARGPNADALYLLGRYHHRVRRDPRVARHYWRELATRFPESDYAPGAYFWYAKAEVELGHGEEGLLVLEQHARRHPDDPGPAALVAQVFVSFDVEGDRAGAAERLRTLLPRIEDADERAEAEELLTSLQE